MDHGGDDGENARQVDIVLAEEERLVSVMCNCNVSVAQPSQPQRVVRTYDDKY